MKVKISDIKVGDRVRRDYGDIEGLANSALDNNRNRMG